VARTAFEKQFAKRPGTRVPPGVRRTADPAVALGKL
jgi:hypothetical protein